MPDGRSPEPFDHYLRLAGRMPPDDDRAVRMDVHELGVEGWLALRGRRIEVLVQPIGPVRGRKPEESDLVLAILDGEVYRPLRAPLDTGD